MNEFKLLQENFINLYPNEWITLEETKSSCRWPMQERPVRLKKKEILKILVSLV